MPYFGDKKITLRMFLEEKSMLPQDRLWGLINIYEMSDKDKIRLVRILQKLHPKYFNIPRKRFDDYVRAFNRLFYKEQKISKLQVEKIITAFIK